MKVVFLPVEPFCVYMPGYNNTMISCLWRLVQTTLDLMIYEGTVRETDVNELLKGRDSESYLAVMTTRGNSALRTTVTDPRLLHLRDLLLIGSTRRHMEFEHNYPLLLGYSYCHTYGSLSDCIVNILRCTPIISCIPKRVE